MGRTGGSGFNAGYGRGDGRAAFGFIWVKSPIQMSSEVAQYANDLRGEILNTLERLAADMESYARNSYTWTDRTFEASTGLTAYVVQEGNRGRIIMRYSQAAFYGRFLELSNGGRYAVIRPTMQSFYPKVMHELQAMLR